MGSNLMKKFKGYLVLGLFLLPLVLPVLSVQAGYSSVDQISDKHWQVIHAAAKKAKELSKMFAKENIDINVVYVK